MQKHAIAILLLITTGCASLFPSPRQFVVTTEEEIQAINYNHFPFPQSQYTKDEKLFLFIQGYPGQTFLKVWRQDKNGERTLFREEPFSIPHGKYIVQQVNPGFGVFNIHGEVIPGLFEVQLLDRAGNVLASQFITIIDKSRSSGK